MGMKVAAHIKLDVDLVTTCKALAKERGQTFTMFVTRALQAALDDPNPDWPPRRRVSVTEAGFAPISPPGVMSDFDRVFNRPE